MTEYDQSIEEAIKAINKGHKESVLSLGYTFVKCDRIPFSSPNLNYLLYGGLPRGRLVEFFGEESSGKTTTALDGLGQFQRAFGDSQRGLFVDLEHTFDEEWAKLFNVKVDDMLYYTPTSQTAEQIFDDVVKLVLTKGIGFIVIDSVPTLLPKDDAAKANVDATKVAGIAKPLRVFLRTNLDRFMSNDCTVILINQNIDKIGTQYPTKTQPGGGAPKYYSSVRMEFRVGDFYNEDGKDVAKNFAEPCGHEIDVHIRKTKICRPDRKLGHYSLNYKEGVDIYRDTVDLAVKYDLLKETSKAWYEIDGQKLHGEGKVVKHWKDNPEAFIKVYNEVNRLVTL